MKLGSKEHKKLFCQTFLDSHIHYEPEDLPWPELDSFHLNRLKSIPFWREALTIEEEAGRMVSFFADTIDDPLIRDAIALQGREEQRHGRLIQYLINHYQLDIAPPEKEELPKDIQKEFIEFGFGECLDSFFAFGMFGIARQAQYLPEPFFTIFDPILDEEARHIVFFVNWVTYLQIQSGKGFPLLRGVNTFLSYLGAIRNLVDSFGDVDLGGTQEEGEVNPFTASGASHFMEDLTPKLFFATCLAENEKRMAKFDRNLLQPMLFPRLSKLAYQVLRILPEKNSKSISNSVKTSIT
ncbi:ferritin-like domain-containing protein [Cyanobacterium sp. Dongsha4]|uniref:ferritin-like domain-containing protein n=1 Tax=Cyanobacterium sp. DS4 TaxID=2878255 RepID=UPI002E809DB8|nr:ferritin-like domain-containing protein [Cyanobacterium sp. Dongsha4]WVK99471.1 ferritin-like domain-containing protein [Cyanobacterium sp. Dongsha4]